MPNLGTAQDKSTTLYNNLKTDFSQKMLALAQARDIREVNIIELSILYINNQIKKIKKTSLFPLHAKNNN